VGRLLIPFLLPGRYYGIDPMEWMIEAGIVKEIGADLIRLRKPVLSNDEGFNLSSFGMKFDFLLAQSVFSHAPQRMVTKCLGEAAKVMRPEAVFAATYLKGESDFTGAKFSPGAPYTFGFFERSAGRVGLACREIPWPHNGQQWILFAWPQFIDGACRRAKHPLSMLAVGLKG